MIRWCLTYLFLLHLSSFSPLLPLPLTQMANIKIGFLENYLCQSSNSFLPLCGAEEKEEVYVLSSQVLNCERNARM